MKDKDFEERLRSLSKIYTLRREIKEKIMKRVRKTELPKRNSIGSIVIILVSLIALIILIPSPSYISNSSYLLKESEFLERFLLYFDSIELLQWMLLQLSIYLILAFIGLFSIVLINRTKLKGGKR